MLARDLSVHRVLSYATCSDKNSRFPDRIDDRASIHNACTYTFLRYIVALRASSVDGFASDLSPQLLGNCLGRGGRAQTVCYRHYGNLPRVNAEDLSLHISRAFFDGHVAVVAESRNLQRPDAKIQLISLNLMSYRACALKEETLYIHANCILF